MGSGTSSSIKVLMAGASWRLFGSERGAESLLDAVSGDDEQNRMLAGISLVKAGQRSFDLIKRKIEAGEATAAVIRLLPDIGGERARPVLQKIAQGEPGEQADTATACIDLLNKLQALEDDD